MRTEAALALLLATGPLAARPLAAPTVAAEQAQTQLGFLRAQLGLGERDAFVARSVFTNGQGETIVHLDQTFAGSRVWGSAAIVHLLPGGGVRTLTSGVLGGVALEREPALRADEAAALALRHLGDSSQEPEVERVVFPAQFTGGLAWTLDANGKPLLDRRLVVHARPAAAFVWAYEVRTRSPGHELTYLIDASTGGILRITDALERQAAPVATPSVGTGNGYYRGNVQLNTSHLADGTYALFDPTRGTLPNPALKQYRPDGSGWTPAGIQAWYEAHDLLGNSTGQTFLFQSNPIDSWGDGKAFSDFGNENGRNGQSAGADAMSGMAATWDFYQTIFGRNGPDGLGTGVYSEVLMLHQGYSDNAYWSQSANALYLGAGTWPANPKGYQSLTDLDIVAHEMTHGVIGSTARFVNSAGYEEAALDEATADFLAQMVKAWAKSSPAQTIPQTGADWQVGMSAGHGTPLLWLNKPSKDLRSPDGWYDGIRYMDGHFSAGPLNRALFFLAQGASRTPGDDAYSVYLLGGMSGIGNDAAARIWFKAVTERLQGDGTGKLTYADARTAAIATALELYPSDPAKVLAVESAFAAANVGDAHGAAPHPQVLFTDFRHGDYIEKTHTGVAYANRQVIPKGETVTPRISVLNSAETSVQWSVGGPSLFNGAESNVSEGGVINADGSWTTPNEMAWHAITATSKADPRQFAEGRVFLINMDTDMDDEQDAVDLGGIAFSWYLSNSLNPAHSVFEAPWVDDADVAYFIDGLKAAWPVQ